MVHFLQSKYFNMKTLNPVTRSSSFIILVIFFLSLLDLSAIAGSFGGSRGGGFRGGGGYKGGGSFGGNRSSSRSYYTPRSSSGSSSPSNSRSPSSSFGGSSSSLYRGERGNSVQEYRNSYGAPRRQEQSTLTGNDGVQRNVVFNRYGGYGDGIMTGYALGSMNWAWYMPFHPAFYYSAPPYVVRPDGVVEYYPATFSFGKVIFMIIIVGLIIFVIRVAIRNRRRGGFGGQFADEGYASQYQSSFD
jgi:hypothetical protein